MQTTYRLHSREIDYNFFEAFKKLFQNKEVKITIEEVPNKSNLIEMFKESEKLNNKYKPMTVSSDIDLSALADDVNL